jgi:hypothetical protein
MIGTTRSRVSHSINKISKNGFIEYNGHLEIDCPLLNVRAARSTAYFGRQFGYRQA